MTGPNSSDETRKAYIVQYVSYLKNENSSTENRDSSLENHDFCGRFAPDGFNNHIWDKRAAGGKGANFIILIQIPAGRGQRTFYWTCRDNGELPLKMVMFVLNNGRPFANRKGGAFEDDDGPTVARADQFMVLKDCQGVKPPPMAML